MQADAKPPEPGRHIGGSSRLRKKAKESTKSKDRPEPLIAVKNNPGAERNPKPKPCKPKPGRLASTEAKCKLEPESPNGSGSAIVSMPEDLRKLTGKGNGPCEYDQAVEFVNNIKDLEWDECNPETNKNSPCKPRLTADCKESKTPFTPSCFWFVVCSQYFPKLAKQEFEQKIEFLKDFVDNQRGFKPILIPGDIRSVPARQKSTEESKGILGWVEKASKRDLLECELQPQAEIAAECLDLNGNDEERVIPTQVVDFYPHQTTTSLFSLRNYLAKDHQREFPEESLTEAYEASKSRSVDSIIGQLEQEAMSIREERCQIWSKMFDRAETFCKVLPDEEEWRDRKKMVDADLREAHPEEDIYLDYVEYRRQYMISFAPYLTAGKTSRKGGKSATIKQSTPKNEDHVCQVCNDGDYTDGNLIVYCSRCGICFHQKCYGIAAIPEGNWVCELCKYYGPAGKYLMCAFCPRLGGCLRRTNINSISEVWRRLAPEYYNYMKSGRLEKATRGDEFYKDGDAFIDDEIVVDSSNYKQFLYYDYFQSETIEQQRSMLKASLPPRPYHAWVHLSCLRCAPEEILNEPVDKTAQTATIKNSQGLGKFVSTSANNDGAPADTQAMTNKGGPAKADLRTFLAKGVTARGRSSKSSFCKMPQVNISLQKLLHVTTKLVESYKAASLLRDRSSTKKARPELSNDKLVSSSGRTDPQVSRSASPGRGQSSSRVKRSTVLDLLQKGDSQQRLASDGSSKQGVCVKLEQSDIEYCKKEGGAEHGPFVVKDQRVPETAPQPKTGASLSDLDNSAVLGVKPERSFEHGHHNTSEAELNHDETCTLCLVSGYLLVKCTSCSIRFHAECARVHKIRSEGAKFFCNRHLGGIRKRVFQDRQREQHEIRQWAGVKKPSRDEGRYVPTLIMPEEMVVVARDIKDKLSVLVDRHATVKREDAVVVKVAERSPEECSPVEQAVVQLEALVEDIEESLGQPEEIVLSIEKETEPSERPQSDQEKELVPVEEPKVEPCLAPIVSSIEDEEFVEIVRKSFFSKPDAQHIWTINLDKKRRPTAITYSEPRLKFFPEVIPSGDDTWKGVSKLTGLTKKKCFQRYRSILEVRRNVVLSSPSLDKPELTSKEGRTPKILEGVQFNATETAGESSCVCGQPYVDGRLMVECDDCFVWYHASCINLGNKRESVIRKIKVSCPRCVRKREDAAANLSEGELLGKRAAKPKSKRRKANQIDSELEEKEPAIDTSFSNYFFRKKEEEDFKQAFNQFGQSKKKTP